MTGWFVSCRFESEGVEFAKRPNDGKMKGLAFIKDPDGYMIEILNATNMRSMLEKYPTQN